jgi:hypothetical protein
MSYTFVTPTLEIGPAGGHRLFEFYTLDVGITIVKFNGEYQEFVYTDEDFLSACDKVYRGGYEYEVSDEDAQELIDAGYEDYLTEIV